MKLSAILAPMISAGVSGEVILQTVQAWESQQQDALEKRREADRNRQAEHRKKQPSHVMSRDVTVTVPSHAPVMRVEDNLLGKEVSGKEERKESRALRASERVPEFDEWYRHYPHKVQRGAAEKAFARARLLASLDDLVEGTRRYVAAKPPDHPWRNPATWLNGKGWMDSPGLSITPQQRAPPSRPRTYADVIRDRMNEETNGTESLPSAGSNVEFLPSEKRRSGPDVENLRSGFKDLFTASRR